MNVLVVDSHAIYRRGLVASLELLEDVDNVDQVDGVCGARERSAVADADIVILDTSIAGGADFMALIAQISGAHVIACTSECDEQAVVRAIGAGAVGYLRKESLTQDVLQAAIHAAAGGAAIVPPDMLGAIVRESMLETHGDLSPLPPPRLAEREQRVLALVAEGHSTREIAEMLSYSERTVKNVLHDIVTKLNVRTRSQAVALAVRDGLI